VLGGAGEAEEAELADLHARPQLDRQGGDVGELEGDVAGEARVDEARRRVREQAQAAEAGLALEPRGDVVRQRDDLEGGGQHELARGAGRTASSGSTSTSRVSSGCSWDGSITGYLWLSKSRK
jgi:hypothetical protein